MTTLPNKMVLLQLVATVLLCFIGNSNGARVLQAVDNDRIRQVDDHRQVGDQRRRHLRRDPGGSSGGPPPMKNKPDCDGPGRLSPYCSQPTTPTTSPSTSPSFSPTTTTAPTTTTPTAAPTSCKDKCVYEYITYYCATEQTTNEDSCLAHTKYYDCAMDHFDDPVVPNQLWLIT